jgi:hypothetical protein
VHQSTPEKLADCERAYNSAQNPSLRPRARPVLVPSLRPVLPTSRRFCPHVCYGRFVMCANAKLESRALGAEASSSKTPNAGFAPSSARPRSDRHVCDIIRSLPLPGFCARPSGFQPPATSLRFGPRTGIPSRGSRALLRHSSLRFLPGTVIRVEAHLTHRKQTTAHALTRNVPAHVLLRIPSWQLGVTRRKSSCASRRAVCYSVGVPPTGSRCYFALGCPGWVQRDSARAARESFAWRPLPGRQETEAFPCLFFLSRCLIVPAPLTGAFFVAPYRGELREALGTQPGAQQPASPNYARAFGGGSHTDRRARVTQTRETSCAF